MKQLWGPQTEKGCTGSQKRGSCVTDSAPSPESKQGVGLESGTCPFGSSSGAKLWDPWTPCGSLQRYFTLILPFSIDAKQTPCSPLYSLGQGSPSSAIRSSRETDFCPPGSGSRGSGDAQLLRPCLTPLSQKAEAGAAASSH